MAIQEILYPTDFSECARYAGGYAAVLARTLGTSIHLLHVPTVPFSPPQREGDDVSYRALERSAQQDAEAQVQRLLQDAEFHGLRVRTTVMAGGIIEDEILKAAEPSDLVVMGTHGRTGLSRVMVGSVTERVVGAALCPVFVVRHPDTDIELPWGAHVKGTRTVQPPPRLLNILVPLDGSPRSAMVLEEAQDLARAFEAVLILFLVLSLSLDLDGMPMGEVTEQYQAEAKAFLQRKEQALREEGLMVETVLRTGDAATEILEYADARSVDLIAMATHGRSGLRRWLLGSVAAKVLQASSLPVLLYRAWMPAE